MHYLLTNRKFGASHWHQFFDKVLHVSDNQPLDKALEHAQTVWLCTAIDEWPTLLERFSTNGRHVAVLALSPSPDEAKKALSRGAQAYVSATAPLELLRNVKTTIAAGGYWIPNELMLHMLEQFNSVLRAEDTLKPDSRLNKLTQRELQVCREVANGDSNKMIARRLHITERTVKEHLSRSFAKLGVKDRMQVMLLVNGKLAETPKKDKTGS